MEMGYGDQFRCPLYGQYKKMTTSKQHVYTTSLRAWFDALVAFPERFSVMSVSSLQWLLRCLPIVLHRLHDDGPRHMYDFIWFWWSSFCYSLSVPSMKHLGCVNPVIRSLIKCTFPSLSPSQSKVKKHTRLTLLPYLPLREPVSVILNLVPLFSISSLHPLIDDDAVSHSSCR